MRLQQLTTCNATYLALPYQLPLTTPDGQLQRAARAEAVALFDPQTAG